MKKKQLIRISKTCHRELTKSSRHIHPGFDTEAIHRFRVAFKKSRAFLRMIADKPIKVSKKLKKAYHLAGAIRDLQLQRNRVLEAPQSTIRKPTLYLSLLQKKTGKQKARLSAPLLRKAVAAHKKKWKAAVPDVFTIEDARSFIHKKLLQLHTITNSPNLSDDHLHETRKILKDLNYDLQALKKDDQEKQSALKKKSKKQLAVKKLLSELGNFQDKCRSLDFLVTDTLANLNKYEQQLLRQLKNSWMNDKMKMKQELTKQLQTTDWLHKLQTKVN